MVNYYFVDLQNNPIRIIKKTRDKALWVGSYLLTNVFLLYFCVRETDKKFES